jgi:hypothetical protein
VHAGGAALHRRSWPTPVLGLEQRDPGYRVVANARSHVLRVSCSASGGDKGFDLAR